MMLLDTSGLLAALFPDQNHHAGCRAALEASPGPFVLSPFVLAELDYLVCKHAGAGAEAALLEDVSAEAYTLPPFLSRDVQLAKEVIDRYPDLQVGLADASIVVLSQRFETLELLSLDERHFRVLEGFEDRPFRILPADG